MYRLLQCTLTVPCSQQVPCGQRGKASTPSPTRRVRRSTQVEVLKEESTSTSLKDAAASSSRADMSGQGASHAGPISTTRTEDPPPGSNMPNEESTERRSGKSAWVWGSCVLSFGPMLILLSYTGKGSEGIKFQFEHVLLRLWTKTKLPRACACVYAEHSCTNPGMAGREYTWRELLFPDLLGCREHRILQRDLRPVHRTSGWL